MKKNIIIICTVLAALSLTTYGFTSWKNSEVKPLEETNAENVALHKKVVNDFEEKEVISFYVGPKFDAFKKADLENVTSFSDFITEEHANRILLYRSVGVTVLKGDEKADDNAIANNSGLLTTAQLELLRSASYSTHFMISAGYRETSFHTGELEDSYWTPRITIVPDKQAVFLDGNDAIIDYVKLYSKEERAKVQSDKLQSATVYFTITKDGTLDNAHLEGASGYPSLDQKMIELITKVPGTWQPAENSKGERVDQELVFTFGRLGC